MKVVHFSTTDYGGAYRAAERINECLRQAGIESDLVVRTKTRDDTDCAEYFKGSAGRFASKARNLLNLFLSPGKLTTDLFGTDVSRSEYVKNADIVILHWVNSFIGYKNVRQLCDSGKMIVCVMHDEWIYTGGMHCAYELENAGVFARNFLSPMNIAMKKKTYSGRGIRFVAVSEWMRTQAHCSDILKDEEITVINDPVDTDRFKPLSRVEDPYGLGDRKLILFGADKATNNANKGFGYLVSALKKLDGSRYMAVCFGASPEETRVKLDNIEIIYTGPIKDDRELVNLYNIAHVMVVPSIQEAFGYTCCEALSCGTPVAAFDTSGLKDQIVHKENGYLARLKDEEDLCKGILYCIENSEKMGLDAVRRVRENNSYKVIGDKYLDLIRV